jgi:predicted dehydrogenase
MPPVQIGVIGLGRFGRLHSLTLNALAEAELVGVVARRPASVEALQKELPGVRGWTDLDAAIHESGAEAWVVACSTSDHVPVTKKLLEAGKTVLLEKPAAETVADAERLAPLVKADSSNLMLGHIILFNTEYRVLSEEIRRRKSLSFLDCVKYRPASIVSQFAGENPLIATMVHDLYAVQMLLDRAEPVHFSAQYHRTPTGAIDLALAQLKWPSGVVASFTAGYLSPTGMAPRGFDRMEVFGDGWSARICPNPRPIEVWDEKAHWPMPLEIWTSPHGATGMLAEELRCFCRVVRGVQPVPVGATFQDALQVQRWMDRLDACAQAT